MGVVPSRQPKRRPPPPRVIKFVPEVEAGPLTTLDELLSYKDPLLCAVEPLNATIRRGRPEDPKILVCHDMMGGYHDDRFIHGGEDSGSYRFHHWQIIDTFVYYTHSLVTIPPPGWITAAHRHGVKVLGTFMLESDEGLKIIEAIRNAGLVAQVAEQLALAASLGRFDGWLVSIGCKVGISCVPFVKDLLAAITEKTHRAIPGSLVIWYDAVDTRGMGKPHNELNERNSCFFGLCDGIFLNFRWNEDMLQRSAQLAGDRKADVYVGVDVFARNTPYLGGFNTPQVVKTVRAHGLSSAVFGPGWVYEKRLKTNYIKNQYRLWDLPDDVCSEWRLTEPPVSTSFCQGFGNSRFSAGVKESTRTWFNLSKQQLQPRDQGNRLCSTCGSATVYLDDAYNGGSCLRLLFRANERHPNEEPYFRLFSCDFPVGSLTISYTFKPVRDETSAGQDLALILKAKTGAGEAEELSLGSMVTQPDGNNYVLRRELSGIPDVSSDASTAKWVTRKYYVEDKRGVQGATLDEIGVRLFCAGPNANVCLLGQLDVKRPVESSAAEDPDAVAELSDVDYEPEEKRSRVHKSEESVATAETTE
ncbi:cytosolic endo-beta-N-acetylglucosaminidase-like [Amblyomma americanum]